MARIDELFNTQELLNYYQKRNQEPMLGDTLFPSKKIQDIKFKAITGADGLPVSASVHAFDSETEIASREALQAGAAKLALIKRKIAIGEEDIIAINNPRTDAEWKQIIADLYKDSDRMVSSVQTRVEAMRMELLATGKIAINENGVAVTLDYKVPKSNTSSFDWSDSKTANPLADLETLADAVEETSGIRPTRAITSKKILSQIKSCESVRKAVWGVNYDKLVTTEQLNDLLVSLDLPKIVDYNAKYRVQNSNGKYTTKRYFPEGILSMFTDNKLGDTIYGLTAEEIELIGLRELDQAGMIGNIFVGVEKQGDPVKRFTKAAATCLPTLAHGNQLGIANINLVAKQQPSTK